MQLGYAINHREEGRAGRISSADLCMNVQEFHLQNCCQSKTTAKKCFCRHFVVSRLVLLLNRLSATVPHVKLFSLPILASAQEQEGKDEPCHD